MSGFGGHGGQKNAPWARGHQGDQPGLVNFGGGQGPPVFQGGPPGVHPGLAGLGPMGGHSPVTSLASAVAGQQVGLFEAVNNSPDINSG
jgi:hypothetical protein